MASTLRVRSGEELQFPVPDAHPLALYQSFRHPTVDDVVNHPFWSGVLEYRIALVRQQLVSESGRYDAVPEDVATRVVGAVIRNIGPIFIYQFPDIEVERNGVLTYFGKWTEVTARNVLIWEASDSLPPGRIRVYCDDPTISATLSLTCTTLAGNEYAIVKPSGPTVADGPVVVKGPADIATSKASRRKG